MKIIRPSQIAEGILNRKDINIYDGVEPTGLYTNYNAGSTYSAGAVVIHGDYQHSDGNRVYQSAQAGNIGNNPDTDDGTWWTYLYSIPRLWANGETYQTNDVCYDLPELTSPDTGSPNNVFTVYESIQDGNIANDPVLDTLNVWWRPICTAPGEWSSTINYQLGEEVFNRGDFGVYECIINNALNRDPATTAYWQRKEASDIYKIRDQVLGSSGSVSRLREIVFAFTPASVINSVALLNVYGITANVVMENTSYNQTQNLTALASGDDDIVTDWYSYFFSETRTINNVVFFNLPNELEKVTITVTASATSYAEIGEIVMGREESLGSTQFAPEFSIIDYSRKTVDEYGNYTIVERAFSKRINIRTIVPNYKIGPVTDLLTSIRTTPVVWVPTEVDIYDQSVIIYGFYKDFKLVIPHAKWAEMDLQIEGLT